MTRTFIIPQERPRKVSLADKVDCEGWCDGHVALRDAYVVPTGANFEDFICGPCLLNRWEAGERPDDELAAELDAGGA